MRTDPRLSDAIDACRAEWDPREAAATAVFDRLLERWPDDPAALVAVAEAYDDAGDGEAAVRYFEQAMTGPHGAELDGTELRRCFLHLGNALREQGRGAEAVGVLERGLEEFPGSRSLRTFLALALHDLGRSDAALGLVLQVLVDPTPSPDLELFAPEVRLRAAALVGRDG